MKVSSTTAFISLAALATANARLLDRRTVAVPEECTSAISEVLEQYDVATASALGWKPSDGYIAALKVYNQVSALESDIDHATSACTLKGTVSETDAEGGLQQLGELVRKVEPSFNALIDKKPQFDSASLVSDMVKKGFKDLRSKTNALNSVILADMPPSHQDNTKAYIKRINDAYDRVYDTYGI